jgi:hypothetical protein
MKLKSVGIFPLLAIITLFSPALCETLVEVISPIANLRALPSATADSRGFAQKGKRFVVDGESGPWYRIRLYNATVWIPKSAVNVLESTEPAAPPPPPPSVIATGTGEPRHGTGVPESAHAGQHTARPPAQPAGGGGTRGAEPAGAAGAEATAATGTPGTPGTAAAQSVAGTPGTAAQPAPGTPALPGTTPEGASPAGQPSAAEAKPAPAVQPVPIATAVPAATIPKLRKAFRPPKGGTWVTQFSHYSQEESGKELFFFQVSENKAEVYALSKTTSPILAEAKKGDFFPLLEEAGVWCKIALKDTTGWIERSAGTIVSAPKSAFIDEFLLIIIVAGALVLVTIVVLTIFLRRKTRIRTQKSDLFRTLIIAKTAPMIQCVISNKTMSLEKYLSAIGSAVKSVHVLPGAQKIIAKTPPDVVFIDWNISDDIPGTVEVLFAGFDEKKLPLAIFYNVPDVSEASLIPVMLRAYHLGRSFSDHEVSKLITPAMLSRTSQKSSAASALEGNIAEGNLPEIMQFIEIGKKTGCLLIETEAPLGMIYFAQGRIIHAVAANNVTGRDAINILLYLKEGKFKFLLNKEPKTSDLNLSTLEVLMDWSKNEDEAHRN